MGHFFFVLLRLSGSRAFGLSAPGFRLWAWGSKSISAKGDHKSPFRLDSSPLRGSAAVVGDGGDVADAGHFQAGGLEGSDGGFSAASGSSDVDVDLPHPVVLGDARRFIGGDLRGERSALSGSLEVRVAGAGPTHRVPLRVGDGHQRVVEGCMDMGHSTWNVLLFLRFAFLGLLSCH